MKWFLCPVVFLLAAAPVASAEKNKPNVLTAKEIAEGWILLFDGKTTFGWEITGPAKVKKGQLVLGGDQATTASTTVQLEEMDLRFEYSGTDIGQAKLVLNKIGTSLAIGPKAYKGWVQGDVHLRSRGSTKGTFQTVDGTGKGFYISASKSRSRTAVTFQVKAKSNLMLRSVKVKPCGLKSVFNGKDLTGWKYFKGKRFKSKFGVSKNGELTIKNGPGDLQTNGQWADFVLQIECKTNGNYLNSGVFFRCQPGKYQQGYEAQIHNKFLPPPGREYQLQVFDPKSHKRVATKKVKYLAADYGTGAIYNRQPARLQTAKDKEWFTMTVIARGRHIAVWVNGMQVTDWTDNRPLSENARSGCRLAKGPISLQGHDPTTDLRFRNIRIAELPKEKKVRK
jgi:hypothetical protein